MDSIIKNKNTAGKISCGMKKIISGIILSAVVLISFFGFNSFNTKEVKAQNIGTLQSIVTPGFSFRKDLLLGDTDPDVRELQRVLNADIDTMINTDGPGGRGKETTYFGQLTKDAVVKFQNKYKNSVLAINNITVADGKVNKNTRTRLNLLLGVMNTYDSVGLPQSRASAVVVTPAPVIVAAPTPQPAMSSCQFVELLISIGAISPDKANAGRSAFSCPTVATPTVIVKANNSESNITVNQNTQVTISWTSSGVTSCLSGTLNKPLIGSEIINMVTTSRTITLTCRTSAGLTVSDSVSVNVRGAPPVLVRVGGGVGYSLAMFDIETNVPTKLYILYRTDSSSTQTASFTSLKSERSEIVTGLTPNTTYYFKIKIVDADGLEYISPENAATTSNDPNADNFNATSTEQVDEDAEGLAQRVLYSSDGGGIVSIPGSESLKFTSKVTLEAWIKPTAWSMRTGISSTTDQVIISKGKIGDNIDFALTVDNGKLVYLNNDAAMWTCAPVIPLNQWTHVAVSVDESTSTINMFVNGTKINSSTTSSSTILTIATGATSTSTTTTAICEGSKGVFNKAMKIDKTKGIADIVASYVDQAVPTQDTSSMSIAELTAWATSMAVNAINSGPTSNVYIGNFYPKMCLASNNSPKENGFIGSIDDVRIWKSVRTESEIKDNMKKSVKGKSNLVAYYTFDDSSASDVSEQVNTGAIKGSMEVIEGEDSPAKLVGPDYSMGAGFTTDEPCYVAPPEPKEPGPPKNLVGGVVIKVDKCLKKPNLTEVVIAPCAASGQSSTAQIYTREGSGPSELSNTLTGNVKINIRDGMQVIPKVGDMILVKAVNDKGLICTSLVGNISSGEPANPEQHVGTVTGPLIPSKASSSCPVPGSSGSGGGAVGNWIKDTINIVNPFHW